MKKKFNVYLVAAICSIVWDSLIFSFLYPRFTEHPVIACVLVLLSILINCLFFMQAKELLKNNDCLVVKLPMAVENDELPKL